MCKFWFCRPVKEKYPMLANIMCSLEAKANDELPMLGYHTSREEYERMLTSREDLEKDAIPGAGETRPLI
jgi:hypothetical protein